MSSGNWRQNTGRDGSVRCHRLHGNQGQRLRDRTNDQLKDHHDYGHHHDATSSTLLWRHLSRHIIDTTCLSGDFIMHDATISGNSIRCPANARFIIKYNLIAIDIDRHPQMIYCTVAVRAGETECSDWHRSFSRSSAIRAGASRLPLPNSTTPTKKADPYAQRTERSH